MFIDENYRQVVWKNILPDIFSLWFFIIFYNVLLFAKLCCNTFHDTNTWQKLTYFMVTAQITSGEKVCLSKYANFYVWATAVSHKISSNWFYLRVSRYKMKISIAYSWHNHQMRGNWIHVAQYCVYFIGNKIRINFGIARSVVKEREIAFGFCMFYHELITNYLMSCGFL